MSAGSPPIAGPLASLASAVRGLTVEIQGLRADLRVHRAELARLSARLAVAVLEAERRSRPLEIAAAEEIAQNINDSLRRETS
ncbi:MAG TPA: hypothetical protein PLS95_14920 [Thermoanaerobaculales bacterium]|nr:hypothetical protein [Thermoanaerobaculales bacterium]HQN97250.1 hypothetical protein [Thermoanaerobaculales bacterium]HQP42852.1 hypothetical protein [Thermoanaerobaculales bacterium]